MYQKDSALAHTARNTHKWFEDNLFGHVAASKLTLTAILLTIMCGAHLKGSLIRLPVVMKVSRGRGSAKHFKMYSEVTKWACSHFRSHLEAVINAEHDLIE